MFNSLKALIIRTLRTFGNLLSIIEKKVYTYKPNNKIPSVSEYISNIVVYDFVKDSTILSVLESFYMFFGHFSIKINFNKFEN
jgi:hypothetical protein